MNISISDYGAVPGEEGPQTESIQSAVRACHQSGGGRVIVPPGLYRSGTLQLLSGVTLCLEAGAVLQASPSLLDYSPDTLIDKRRENMTRAGLLVARNAHDIGIEGPGWIDGHGRAFLHPDGGCHTSRDIEPAYTRQGAAYLADESLLIDAPLRMRERPGHLIHFLNCCDIRLSGFRVLDSPSWTIHLADCDRAWLDRLAIDNSLRIPNSDGIHGTCCRDLFISRCSIRGGDDALAITTFGETDRPSENILVSDCLLESKSCALRIGHGPNDIRYGQFHHLVIRRSNRGIGLFARTGGCLQDLHFSNLQLETRLCEGWWGHGEPVHLSCLPQHSDRPSGAICRIVFDRLSIDADHGILLHADQPGAISQVSFNHVRMRLHAPAKGPLCGGNFDLRPAADPRFRVFRHDIAALHARQVHDLSLQDFQVHAEEPLPAYLTTAVIRENEPSEQSAHG